jgi:hypothetical protein
VGFVASEQGFLPPEPYEDDTTISITVKLESSSEAMGEADKQEVDRAEYQLPCHAA